MRVQIKVDLDNNYYINDVPINECSKYTLMKVNDELLNPSYVNEYMISLSPYQFDLELIDELYCDQCGTNCEDWEGVWKGIEISYSIHCFGEFFEYKCSDNEMLIKLLKENINPRELFEIAWTWYNDCILIENGAYFTVYELKKEEI